MAKTDSQIKELKEQLQKAREEERHLREKLEEVQVFWDMANELANNIFVLEFCEGGAYEEKLAHIAKRLQDGPGLESYQRCMKKKKELDQEQKRVEEANRAREEELKKQEKEIEEANRAREEELKKQEKEIEEANKVREEELKKLQKEIEEKQNKQKRLECQLEEEQKRSVRIDLISEKTLEEIKNKRSCLGRDQQLLAYLDMQDTNAEEMLKEADELFQRTEELIRKVIFMKENRAEKIGKIVRGDKN